MYDRELHVLDLDPYEEKVGLPQDDVPEVVAPLLVLALNVEAVLDPHLNLDGLVELRLRAVGLHDDLVLLLQYGHEPAIDQDEPRYLTDTFLPRSSSRCWRSVRWRPYDRRTTYFCKGRGRGAIGL